KLQTERRIVVLHYSPIRATLKGEDPEIFAFLGSSRLEEPINRFRVNAVFHGHAHHGILDGKTSTGIPVYNVSAPALRKTRKRYRIVDLYQRSMSADKKVGCVPRYFSLTIRHASTSARVCVGELHRTSFNESKIVSENGTSIVRANRR